MPSHQRVFDLLHSRSLFRPYIEIIVLSNSIAGTKKFIQFSLMLSRQRSTGPLAHQIGTRIDIE